MRTLTIRTIFERASILRLLEEPEFDIITLQGIAKDKLKCDHYFSVFVFSVQSGEDGNLLLRVTSTTVVGIQRYTTKRISDQGVYVISALDENSLITETLRAHFRAWRKLMQERVDAIPLGPQVPLHWNKQFENGAGDLDSPPEFVISDPELEELDKLFNARDPLAESDNLDE